MHTNAMNNKIRWLKSSNGSDTGGTPAHLAPLRKADRSIGGTTSSLSSTPRPPRESLHRPISPVRASLPRSPLPLPSPGATAATETTTLSSPSVTIMDPLAALRRCLQYVCSHPEVYGDDVRGLLDREVMHVVRLKASEVSMTHGQRAILVAPLESSSVRQSTRDLVSAALMSTTSAASIAPSAMDEGTSAGDLFGYGSVSFLPAGAPGFDSLLQSTRSSPQQTLMSAYTAALDPALSNTILSLRPGVREDPPQDNESNSPVVPQPAPVQRPLDEAIQWDSTLPPSTTCTGVRTLLKELQEEGEAGEMMEDERRLQQQRRRTARSSTPPSAQAPLVMTNSSDGSRGPDWKDTLHKRTDGSSRRARNAAACAPSCAADGSRLVVDQQGYEVTFLRTQLQQLEAAYNAKCVRLHELETENKRLAELTQAAEASAARYAGAHHTMANKLEALRRELDGWKDRANEAANTASKQNKQRTQHARQLATTQINDAKQETVRLTQLWRETERALQESRRAFENTEKEATAAHVHLTDAFHYIERLERRVARRDGYVEVCERRQRSLEEKYEKVFWGYGELQALEGRHSYVDYLLTTRPLWSVYMFVLLTHRRGDYVAMEYEGEWQQRAALLSAPFPDPSTTSVGAVAKPSLVDPPETHGWLLFARTPRGGRYGGAGYDPKLVLQLMVEEATGELGKRGRVKPLQGNLPTAVACRALRWTGRYNIDYLGGPDGSGEVPELQHRCVPLLTLASVVLPLRSGTGNSTRTVDPLAQTGNSTTVRGGVLETPLSGDSVGATITNSRHFDEATIRFVLHCFWRERLEAFTTQLQKRVDCHRSKEKRGGSGFSMPAAEETQDAMNKGVEEDEADVSSEDVSLNATFLSALVDFCTRFTFLLDDTAAASTESPPGLPTSGGSTDAQPSQQTRLRVRAVLAAGLSGAKLNGTMNSRRLDTTLAAATSPWECGRIFFATVLQYRPTDPVATEVTSLADGVRELLAALYYYTMEYKTQDPDFRLFHLVSHQLIPEMVAVNFFASIEAVQRDCMHLLEARLRRVCGERNPQEEMNIFPSRSTNTALDPLAALNKVMDIMDAAPVDGADAEVEPDSDGEGCGSILPYHATCKVKVGSLNEELPACADTRPRAIAPDGPLRRKERRLVHNIRAYLQRQEERPASPTGGGGKSHAKLLAEAALEAAKDGGSCSSSSSSPPSAHRPAFSVADTPAEWTGLEEEVMRELGPHTALLDTFRTAHRHERPTESRRQSRVDTNAGALVASRRGSAWEESRTYHRRQRASREERQELARCLGATRGLVPLQEVLGLLHHHCFATYAVSCCGTPRFSLTETLMRARAHTATATDALFSSAGDEHIDMEAFDPYSIVGHLPPTGVHLQRLRFAVSLDHPSQLLDVAKLFTVDGVSKANSHLYNTYLTLTLDLVQQQQSFFMDGILHCCACRHAEYAEEGTEDCDGQVPIASLKKGMQYIMSTIHGGQTHALALVNHLVQYDELLRLEDEVKLEQFADAPILLNIPSDSSAVGLHGAWVDTIESRAAGDFLMASSNAAAPASTVAVGTMEEFMQEAEEEWNLQEAAETCSLLHLAFAIRMTYIVWGSMCAPMTENLVQRMVQLPLPPRPAEEESSPDQRDRARAVTRPEWDLLERDVHERYKAALQRVREGHNGDDNPLRRTLRGVLANTNGRGGPGPYASTGGPSTASGGDVAGQADSLYPDLSRTWGQPLPDGDAQQLLSPSSAQTATTLRTMQPPTPEAAEWNSSSVPDFGLLSLSRALGFATPRLSAKDAARSAGAASAAKKNGSKKDSKKPGTGGKKGGGAEAGAIPVAVQEAYGGILSAQLRSLAGRVARIGANDVVLPLETVGGSCRPSSAPTETHSELHAETLEKQDSDHIAAAAREENAAAPASRPLPRTRSVMFLREPGSSETEKKTSGAGVADDDKTQELSWTPVFSSGLMVTAGGGGPAPPAKHSAATLDVSRLYGACAALVIL